MAAELGLLYLAQHQKLAQSQQNHHHQDHSGAASGGMWMWNSKQAQEDDDDSWEVRAFAEDTGNAMGTTWPPRSYTCTFCRREFRSAQALGGHMNVHRRDRARLHQAQPLVSSSSSPINPNPSSAVAPTSSSPFIIPNSTNGGLCLLYQLPNPNGVFTPITVTGCPVDSPSTLLSISPSPLRGGLTGKSLNFPEAPRPPEINSSPACYSSKAAEPGSPVDNNRSNITSINMDMKCKELENEEIDLELRLGHGPTTTSSSSS